MRQTVEWRATDSGRGGGRAFRNVAGVVGGVVLLVLAALPAAAVTPPRPDSGARLPVVLERWPDLRPGRMARVAIPSMSDKSAAAAVSGLQRVPVIPGDFSDRAGVESCTALQGQFTGSPVHGSVRDYWYDASGGRLDVVGEVADWVRAPETVGYYADTDYGLDLWNSPRNAGGFVRDVVVAANARGLDWGRYDNDGPDGVPNSGDDDGTVDCAVIVHAGAGGECGGAGLWSHAFFLAGWGFGAYVTDTPRSGGGFISVNDYILVPEQSCSGDVIEIGVICHEYGHALGLPDLYDTAGGRDGIGGWGLMGSGGWGGDGRHPEQPTLPCAWSRRELGWCTVTEVRQDGPVSLPAVVRDDQVILLRDPNQPQDEAFLVENRLREGVDGSLPAGGLLIWHIDEGVIAAQRALNEINAGSVPGVALEQADGLGQLNRVVGGNNGDAGDPWPGSTGSTSFAAGSVPPSDDNAGAPTDVVVRGIPTAGDPAAFMVEIGVTDLDVTAPVVSVLVPVGGERWTLGDMHAVTWAVSDAVGVESIDVALSRDGGLTFPETIGRDLPPTSVWSTTVSGVPGADLILKVIARDAEGNAGEAVSGVFDLRDRYAPGVLMICSIDAGATLQPGDSVDISWDSADNVAVRAVAVELSCDGGSTWEDTGNADLDAAGNAVWTVPDRSCRTARLRVSACDEAGNVGWDTSEVFAIGGTTTDVPGATALDLGPCVPNPFNPRAEIVFRLPTAGATRIAVHDVAGRRVRTLVDRWCAAGRQSVIWDGCDDRGRGAASGVYWVRAVGPGGGALLKVTLVR